MRRIIWLVAGLLMVWSLSSLAATEERPMLLRVGLQEKGAIDLLQKGGFDIAYVSRGQFAEIVADDNDYKRLQEAGLNPEIIHEDLVAFYQSRFPIATDMGGFPTLDEALAFMDSLHQLYPDITTARDSIGYTIEGRPIWMMKISDNPEEDEDEAEFFINSLIHAREPMTLEATLRFMAHLCDNYDSDPEIADLVDNREFYFVPVINPDGYEYNRQTNPNGGGMWRKNRLNNGDGTFGVDLNRNWGYMWGYDDNGSSPYTDDETYRGTGPFSEPETSSLRQFIISRDFSLIMNLHVYGDVMLYPWGYYDGYTPDNDIFRTLSDSACAENDYEFGTVWELLYNTNGDAADWSYGEQEDKPKIFGFVIEMGSWYDGFWPDPSRIPQLWADVLPALLYLSRVADNIYIQAPPQAPILNPIGDVYADSFIASWVFSDTLNPAVAFELKELIGLERVEDGFEDGTSNWVLDGFYRTTSRRHSGSYSLYSGSDDNYNGSAVLVNPVSIGEDEMLRFWAWYDIENNWDYAYVQLSTDGGSSFINLEGNITTNDDPYGNNQGNGITGNSGGWVLAEFPLNDYAGRTVLLGMRYVTDGSVTDDGFYADEFYPVEIFGEVNILSSDIIDTFYVVSGRDPGDYYYQVRARDAEDQWSVFSNREVAHVHPPTGIDDSQLPVSLSLNQNYPNPFNPQTVISFSIPQRGLVQLTIYNILGSKVRTLVNSEIEAGEHVVIFDSIDDQGSPVAPGIYFYRLKTESDALTRKMVLIK